jgi:hypothetical protein
MSDREARVNELRKARGLKPLPTDQIQPFGDGPPLQEEKSPFEEILEMEVKKTAVKKKKKKDIITETKEEINTDSLFEADPETVNKEEAKVEEELLNE